MSAITDSSGLLSILSQCMRVPEALAERISSLLREDQVAKDSVILKEGETASRVYFIKEGFARSYYYNNGKEFTSWFMQEGGLMISIYSFYRRKPALENIEMLEDSVLQSISWQQLQELYREFPELNIAGRILTEQYCIKSEERSISLRTLNAKERYEQLTALHPSILRRAKLGHIASHLGISQETLSRIRAGK